MVIRLLLAAALMVAPLHANSASREKELLSAIALQNADQNAWFHKLAGSFENDATRIQEALSRQKPAPQPPGKKAPPAPVFSMPVVLLFIAAALVFTPSVFRAIADTLYNDPSMVPGTDGMDGLRTKLPALSAPELRLVAGVLVSRILKDDPNPPTLALLKDVMAFLTTYRIDAEMEPVLEGALAGIRDQNHHLNTDEKATVLSAVTRWVTGSCDERQLKPSAIGHSVGSFVQHAVGQLDDAGFSREEQAALTGEIVKGAIQGLGEAGLGTAQEINAIRGIVKEAAIALANNDTFPDALSPALDGILKGALAAAVSPQYPTRQQRQAMAGVLQGVSDGVETLLPATKKRQLAMHFTAKSASEDPLGQLIERHGGLDAAAKALTEKLLPLPALMREAVTRGEEPGKLRELSAETFLDYQRLKNANAALLSLEKTVHNLVTELQRP